MTSNPVAKQLLDFQKQVVEFQKSAFENTFNAMVTLQDQQQELLERLLDQASRLPPEAKESIETWMGSYKNARSEFKASADRSFELVEQYLGRLTEGDGEAAAESRD